MQQSRENTDRAAALSFLLGRIDYERAPAIPYQTQQLKLERMEHLLGRLGNPHHRLKVVHVAGSKGKGSTAVMIASVLIAAGLRTGLYTSPHLEKLEERIAVDGSQCTAGELVELVGHVRPEVEALDQEACRRSPWENGPTYFEITTALAFLHFCQKNVELVVLEVGLGGRLDSTNVCHPVVSVITSISLDHTKQLGETLAKIAAEKAGIIKPGVPVVSGVRDGPARRIIEQAARRQSSPLATLGVDFDFRYRPPPRWHRAERDAALDVGPMESGGRMDYHCLNQSGIVPLDDLLIGLPGRHQAANAAVALAVVDQLRGQSWEIPETAVRRGLADASCPARVEIVRQRPLVIIDGAHNAASIRALLETLDELHSGGRRLLVFATTRGKDTPGMLRELMCRFDRVYFTRYLMNPRSEDPQRLLRLARQIVGEGGDRPKSCQVEFCADPIVAWRTARKQLTELDLLCVTGSFFLAAELRSVLLAAEQNAGRGT